MDVFLSYHRQDQEVARGLVDLIQDAGFSVWWDQQITGGMDFSDAVLTALRAARVVVVLLTPSSVRSEYVMMELGVALQKSAMDPLVRLIPVVDPGLHSSDLPPVVRNVHPLSLDELNTEAGRARLIRSIEA